MTHVYKLLYCSHNCHSLCSMRKIIQMSSTLKHIVIIITWLQWAFDKFYWIYVKLHLRIHFNDEMGREVGIKYSDQMTFFLLILNQLYIFWDTWCWPGLMWDCFKNTWHERLVIFTLSQSAGLVGVSINLSIESVLSSKLWQQCLSTHSHRPLNSFINSTVTSSVWNRVSKRRQIYSYRKKWIKVKKTRLQVEWAQYWTWQR